MRDPRHDDDDLIPIAEIISDAELDRIVGRIAETQDAISQRRSVRQVRRGPAGCEDE